MASIELVSLNVCSRKFTKQYLTVGLYKVPTKTGLGLSRKVSVKMLSELTEELSFWLYRIEFLTKQAALPPLRERSNLIRSYFSQLCSKLYRQI